MSSGTVTAGASGCSSPPVIHAEEVRAAPVRAPADVAIIPLRRSRLGATLRSLGWQTVYEDDVAEVLHHQASEPLDLEIEELEALLELLAAHRSRQMS